MKHAIVHVADIHYRKETPEGASSIIKAFIEDLKAQIRTLPDYQFSIAVTGDIVQAGADVGSYEAVIAELDDQLTAMGIPKNARIVVPGNHDIDRKLVEDNYDDYMALHVKHTKTEPEFNNFMCNHNRLYDKFENYELFVSGFSKHEDFFSRLGWGYNIDDNVGVYCLNSAVCSFGGVRDVDDHGMLAIYTRGLVEWCNNKTTTANILLLHHPLDHLNAWSRTELQTIIEKSFCLCLSGHNHLPAVYHNRIPHSSLMCTAPPLFSSKQDTLAYSIILIENNEPSLIKYREYSNGAFFPSPRLAKTDDGIVKLDNIYLHSLQQLESRLQNALESFKGQPPVFIKPKLSESREFNDKANLLDDLIDSPANTLIIAPPQFGLTCLALYIRVQAFKQKRKLLIYIDAAHVKARNVLSFIEEELQRYNKQASDIESIMIDGWDNSVIDHSNMVKAIDERFTDIPLVLFSSKTVCLGTTFSLSKANRTLKVLHLQALTRNSMRELVSGYNEVKNVGKEDEVLSHMTKHMEAINIHRTAMNCLTLLRVLESNYTEKVLNRTKLMKAILFVLFTDNESFSYSSENPEVDECTFVLGIYCKDLVMQATGSFDASEFQGKLRDICTENLISLDVDKMIQVLVDNCILVRYGNTFEFKHTFWIFYFAAECMMHDDSFKSYIMGNQKYVNFPEIIEFYAGIDGKREDAMIILLSDLNSLMDKVDDNIGIKGTFNPLSTFLWNPSEGFIEKTRQEIAEKLESSNMPSELKDKHADKNYNSEAPYNQSINKFLDDYAVRSMLQSIKATSRALRSSTFIKPELKLDAARAIFRGWEAISKVIFWISPSLAQKGRAAHDGLNLVLASGFSEDKQQRFKEILLSNPLNVAMLLKDDLSSKKIGPLLCKHLAESDSEMQRHLVAIFLLEERPTNWSKHLLEHLNLLHPSSFYLGNLLSHLEKEIITGFIEKPEEIQLKKMVAAVIAKRRYAGKTLEKRPKIISPGMLMNKENELPIDQLLSSPTPRPRRSR